MVLEALLESLPDTPEQTLIALIELDPDLETLADFESALLPFHFISVPSWLFSTLPE